jgi:hypothetical protein
MYPRAPSPALSINRASLQQDAPHARTPRMSQALPANSRLASCTRQPMQGLRITKPKTPGLGPPESSSQMRRVPREPERSVLRYVSTGSAAGPSRWPRSQGVVVAKQTATEEYRGPPHPLSTTVAPFRAWRGLRCAVGGPERTLVSRSSRCEPIPPVNRPVPAFGVPADLSLTRVLLGPILL